MTINKRIYYLITVLLSALLFAFALTGCEDIEQPDKTSERQITQVEEDNSTDFEKDDSTHLKKGGTTHLEKDGSYTSKEDVMNYLIEYKTLPSNFITKQEAKKLGWSGGSLEPYAPGKCIGGDRFKNFEGNLPEDEIYHECDIDTLGAKSRGAKRIVYSDSGNIYFTEDHYETFECLYGEEDE